MERASGFDRAGRAARALFFASLLLLPGITAAGSTAMDFGARRHVAEPKLTVSNEPELCASVLADAKALFDSSDADLDLAPATYEPLVSQSWDALPDGERKTADAVGRLDLDLDGTGHKQVLIHREVFLGPRDEHYADVFPSVEAYERAANATVLTGNYGFAPAIFEWHGRYYFFSGDGDWDPQFNASTNIFRLHADGTTDQSCRVEFPTGEAEHAKFEALPAVSSFLQVLRRIGAGGPDCGTLHSGYEHEAGALAAERRAAVRPWATSRSNGFYYDYDDRAEAFLAAWGQDELWNWREYQTLLHHIGPARDSIAAYLVAQFGVAPDKARARAVEVVHALIGARLLIPREAPDSSVKPLEHAILARDEALLVATLEETRDAADPGFFGAAVSDALADAVEWPSGLERLLAAGADPNRPNAFGKTPLMVAAHLNRIDSARRLLSAGARVDAVTGKVVEGCGIVSFSADHATMKRTALMYAAENASPVLMKLLIDAGADAKDVDSYLTHNPRLTAAERGLGITRLVADAEKFRGPSFNCASARTKAELAICDSEVLRIFDAELARAYAQFQVADGKSAAVSQRNWLRERDRQCAGSAGGSGADEVADCLAEATRTRIRYLHNRIAEDAAK